MDNYNDIAAQETKLEEKKLLLDDTIKVGKLSQYEIIKRMLDGLVIEMEELKQVLFTDLAVTNVSKEKAEKIAAAAKEKAAEIAAAAKKKAEEIAAAAKKKAAEAAAAAAKALHLKQVKEAAARTAAAAAKALHLKQVKEAAARVAAAAAAKAIDECDHTTWRNNLPILENNPTCFWVADCSGCMWRCGASCTWTVPAGTSKIQFQVGASGTADIYMGETGIKCEGTVSVATPQAGSVTLILG